MKKYFESTFSDIQKCTSEVESRVRVISTIRLLMQQVNYALLEWLSQQKPPTEILPDQATVQSLKAPSDGALVEGFEALAISCEKLGWVGISRLLLKPVGNRPAGALCSDGSKTLQGLLRAVVSLRNDGAEGHGLVGGYHRDAETDALKFILATLAPLVPKLTEESKASIGSGTLKRDLEFIRGWGRSPALIRRIKTLSSDRVRVHCQIDAGPNSRNEFTYEAVNPFKYIGGRSLPSLSICENSWEPFCYLPDRITDSFTGRGDQLNELGEWFNDEESRACLIFGDGGFGKTTLVLEFLHRVLDEELSTEWKPTVILFYTAKRWQWGLNGLEPISAGQPHLMELVSFIHLLLFAEYPEPNFYRMELPQAAIKLQAKIKDDLKLSKKDILIVIDNAETLIENEEERVLLGKELKEISRRLGRVLLTSRRHEHIEAAPIGIDVLSEREAIDFLRDRSQKLDIKIIKKAKDSDILDAMKKLERRPIVLNTFANVLSDPGTKKIDTAANHVAAMLRKDLGTFLFADAWARLSQGIRRLLLLMTRIGDVHDGQSLRICADIVGVSVQSAELALEESGGIASLITVQGDIQLTFSNNFLEYARDKNVSLADGAISPSELEIRAAQTQYSAFLKGTRLYSGDRIAAAFSTPQAKAAHRARKDGNLEECQRLYEAAVMIDRDNGWLWDRYAYFLFHDIHDNEAALHKSKKAVELLPDEGEVWLTRGLIEARMGDVRACAISVGRAETLGVAWPRCAIQRAWSYLKAKPVQLGLVDSEVSRLKTYIQTTPSDTRILLEIERLERRIASLRS